MYLTLLNFRIYSCIDMFPSFGPVSKLRNYGMCCSFSNSWWVLLSHKFNDY